MAYPTAQYPGALPAEANMLEAADQISSTLNGAITAGSPADGGNLALVSTTGFPTTGGVVRITSTNELISYTGVSVNNLTNIDRGHNGTTAQAADSGATVELEISADYVIKIATEVKAGLTELGVNPKAAALEARAATAAAVVNLLGQLKQGVKDISGTTNWYDAAPTTLQALLDKLDPLDQTERTSDPASPASGYRRIFARDSGGLFTKDAAGNAYALAFAGGNVVLLPLPLAITLTTAGAPTDADSDADGAIVVDKTNGRIYFRHSGGTWHYVARLVDQAEMNLTAAASATKKAVRYDEFAIEHTAADGTHGNITADSIKNDGPHDQQEETADPASPASGYRRFFARDSGGAFTEDDAGNVYALAFAGGNVAALIDEPRPASWQHKDTATGSVYGDLRIEWGRDTLSTGTKAITFQKAFTTMLEIFLIDKTAANAMYPSAIGTSGFTANGTGSDTFGWLAIGSD